MENASINIEEIMSEIKRNIKEQGLTSDMLSFEDVPFNKTAQSGSAPEALDYLTSHYYIQPYKEIQGNPVKVFVKKVLRKLVTFYVAPIVFEQNDFNANAVTVMKAEDIVYELDKAIYISTHGRKGPVWVDIPLDVQNTEIDPETLRKFDEAEIKDTDIVIQRGENSSDTDSVIGKLIKDLHL